MTLRMTSTSALLASLACFAVIGCGAPPAGTATQEEPAGQAAGTLLASVTTQDGRTIAFRELAGGSVTVEESGEIGRGTLLGTQPEGKSLAEIYGLVQPGTAVPQAIVDADARFASARTKAVLTQVPAPAEAAPAVAGATEKFYNAGEQTWFKSTFCNKSDVVDCVQGWDWANTAWHLGNYFSSVAMVGSEGHAATFNLYNWVCGASCAQVVGYTTPVQPGHYTSAYYFNTIPQWHISDLKNAGALVSLTAQVDNASIRGTQNASNYLSIHGDNFWGESTVYLYADGIPGRTNGLQMSLGFANIGADHKFDWSGIVTCIPTGSARNPVTLRAAGQNGGTVVQTGFIMAGCW